MDYMPPPNVEQVTSQYVRSASSMNLKNVAQQTRVKAIVDSGRSIGIKAGINWQLYYFNKSLEKHSRDLDLIYDFGKLMIKGRVVPPVISEVRDIYSQDDETSIKISGISYKIESQARFSSVPPNWRSYLSFGQGNTDFTPQVAGLSLNGEEATFYKQSIKDGFQDGIEQANKMIGHGFDRLNRDYTGMIRFNTFVLQGRISMPIVANANIPVTQTGDTLTLDEKLLRITVLPSFNSNLDNWKAWVTPSKGYKQGNVPIIIKKHVKN
jgi:defect in organelle trafficking protein DotC